MNTKCLDVSACKWSRGAYNPGENNITPNVRMRRWNRFQHWIFISASWCKIDIWNRNVSISLVKSNRIALTFMVIKEVTDILTNPKSGLHPQFPRTFVLNSEQTSLYDRNWFNSQLRAVGFSSKQRVYAVLFTVAIMNKEIVFLAFYKMILVLCYSLLGACLRPHPALYLLELT